MNPSLKRALRSLIVIGCLCGIFFCIKSAVTTKIELVKEKSVYDNISAEFKTGGETVPGNSDEGSDKLAPPKIDHEGLKKKNEDYIAWISWKELGIDLPIVQGRDDVYYLRHNFDKEYALNGTVFLHYENKKDFSDPHSIIYGHNMLDDTMFGMLFHMQDNEYANKNDSFWLCTPNGSYLCHVFCVKEVDPNDRTYTFFNRKGDAFNEWLTYQLSTSEVETKHVPISEDRIITLSTCARDGSDNRRVIVEAIIEKEIYD